MVRKIAFTVLCLQPSVLMLRTVQFPPILSLELAICAPAYYGKSANGRTRYAIQIVFILTCKNPAAYGKLRLTTIRLWWRTP